MNPRFQGLTVIIALALAFVLGAFAVSFDYRGEYQEVYPEYVIKLPIEMEGATATGPKSVLRRPCFAMETRDDSELCAQWRAANAAKQSARWNFWQLLSGLAGVAGLVITLLYNRRALDLALASANDTGRALQIAERNAEAAGAMVAETGRIGEAQVRCYLTAVVVEVGVAASSGNIIVRCKVRNTGQSTARSVRCSGTIKFTTVNGLKTIGRSAGTYENREQDIGSGSKELVSYGLDGDLDEWKPMDGSYIIYADFVINTNDVFGKEMNEPQHFCGLYKEQPDLSDWFKLSKMPRLVRKAPDHVPTTGIAH